MRLTLRSGRTISLARLEQSRTYEGFDPEWPDGRFNARIIERLLDEARSIEADGEPHLLVPTSTSFDRKRPSPGALRAMRARPKLVTGKTRFATYEHLPAIACVGLFVSGALQRAGSVPDSSLTVLWFQDAFGPPIAEPVLSGIAALDWEGLAKDWCW